MTSEGVLLEIQSDGQNGPRILRVRGELDLTNTTVLDEALETISDGPVILDLAGVVFVDSAGIRAINTAYKRLREEDRTLMVVAPPDSRSSWTFRIAGFTNDFVVDSIDTALSRANAQV